MTCVRPLRQSARARENRQPRRRPDVQPAGRSALELRSNAAGPACQLTRLIGAHRQLRTASPSTSTTSVSVAVRIRPPSIGAFAEWGTARVAFVGVIEADGNLGLTGVHDYVGNTVRRTAVCRSEVGMQVSQSAGGDQRGRRRIHGCAADHGVPRIIVGKRTPAAERRAATGRRLSTRVVRCGRRRIAGRGAGGERENAENRVCGAHIHIRCRVV